jgi:uncharacterized protein
MPDSEKGTAANAAMTSATGFHVMAKPRGAVCNLACRYCFYLRKESLYPDGSFRMPESVLRAYVDQYIDSQPGPEVVFAWQGGEPTLMGLDFFKRAVELQQAHCPPGKQIRNSLQTNGTLLDDAWGQFLGQHKFLVGISIDGPSALHDAYRVDKGGRPTFDRVEKGLRILQKHDVDFNILCSVHAANAGHPLEVYRFFRDDLGAEFVQFIPIVEPEKPTASPGVAPVTERSVSGKQFGSFLKAVFDEWVRHDVGKVFVQIFDVALGVWAGQPASLCVFGRTCGTAMALEHNGDLYSCDHFVYPEHRLGNILETPMDALAVSEHQRRFGLDKWDALPQYCHECPVEFACNGGCPKNRVSATPDGEPGLNYLCEGYRGFFTHVDRPMRLMVGELRARRPPANIMRYLKREDEAELQRRFAHAKRNDPCPCGSGLKFKHCHGRAGGPPSRGPSG